MVCNISNAGGAAGREQGALRSIYIVPSAVIVSITTRGNHAILALALHSGIEYLVRHDPCKSRQAQDVAELRVMQSGATAIRQP